MGRIIGLRPNSKQKPGGIYNLVGRSSYQSAFLAEDTKPIREIKPRRPPPKVTKPSNWKDSEVVESSNKKSEAPYPFPLVNAVDDRTLAACPSGRPIHEATDVVQCKHCRKPVIRLAATGHVRQCLRKKQEKLQKKKEAKEAKDAAARREKGEDEDGHKPGGGGGGRAGKKATAAAGGGGAAGGSGAAGGAAGTGGPGGGGAGKGTADARKSKKRKADGDGDKPPAPKKKKKDEPKAKQPKVKMPVDVERQCGVILPNGSQCARSLTCKSHSMGAKRAVPGRSLPYDMLLAQYQKKNQAKQQRAAMDANAPPPDEFENTGPVDPDEEKALVVGALATAFPRPVYNPPPVDIRRKYQYVRLKGILSGLRGSGLFGTGGGGGGVNGIAVTNGAATTAPNGVGQTNGGTAADEAQSMLSPPVSELLTAA